MSSRAAVTEARRVMKPPETERSRTLSIGLAKASKDERRTIAVRYGVRIVTAST